eukprot:CAMPEP_0170334492 /NCGR_PEP_ID=MMETSP0116_2-20130129/68278_1 /TAXON_ID=400756 /ORGANISM="Durinskia baltica, Strain CSIRO CS-38" /LENGTH=35 /DNA_ID= /DNA_START= /DNA_END= /DNA_ORIENTATION=
MSGFAKLQSNGSHALPYFSQHHSFFGADQPASQLA